MMWKPNSVRTTSEIAPGLRRNATSSNSFTITPRRNQPSTPPCSRDTLSAEYFFATSAKVAPPFFRSATTSDSASCSARTLAAESGFGTITIWRKEMAAGRLACCSRFDSQNARISASDGAIGRSFPFCLSPSINRCCRIARRCWSASQRRHSSSDTNPAARSCDWNSGIEVNCLRTFWTVCSTASCTSWSVTLIVVSRSACCTSSSSSTICERTCRRADRLCTLQRPRDSRLVDRPRLVLAERAGQEGRDRVERCAAPGHRLVHVPVDVRHGELHTRGGGRGGVLEELGRDVQQALEPRDGRVVLGAQAPPVVRAEPYAGLVHLYEQHLTLREHLDELVQLGVARRGDPAHVVRIERQEPPRQIFHPEREIGRASCRERV